MPFLSVCLSLPEELGLGEAAWFVLQNFEDTTSQHLDVTHFNQYHTRVSAVTKYEHSCDAVTEMPFTSWQIMICSFI